MPTFATPEPITATIVVAGGDVRIRATDDGATVVEVRPSDASSDDDKKAAAATRVEYANGQLLVKGPKASWLGKRGASIDVTVALPAASRVRGAGRMADFNCEGLLGECRISTGLGRIRVDQAGVLHLKSGVGDISVEHATGHAEVTTASGEVRAAELDRSAVIKNSNGDTWVGIASGDVRLNTANGSISVDRARGGVVAKTANGDVRVGEVVRGAVVLETRVGDLDVGIREGTAAWLDVSVTAGTIRNELAASEAPGQSAEAVELRARSSVGAITIRRAPHELPATA